MPVVQSRKFLEETVHALEERVKELRCLYTVSALTQQVDLSPEALLPAIADALVQAYQFPEAICVRIVVGDHLYCTEGFQETPWGQTAALVLANRPAGRLDVFLRKEHLPADNSPFLKEEQELLNTVAQILGRSLEERRERTARRESEARALRREQEFRALADNLPDIVARFDKALRHLYVNPAIEKFTSTPRESFVGRTNAELGMPEDVVTLWDARLLDVFETGREQSLQFHFPSPTGERYFESRLIPEPGPGRQVKTVLAVVHELTEHVQVENQLRELTSMLQARNVELAQTNQRLQASNAELEKFTSVVSHDLKAPLRAVHGLSSWIEEEVGESLSDEGRARMTLLRDRVRLMDELIDALLDYSRAGGEVRELVEVDSAELVGEVTATLLIPERFSVSAAPDLPRFETDRLHLRQVFANLIGNAVEHHDRCTGHVRVSVRDLGDFFEFAVADDGPGIAPQYHARIFEIFQRLDPRKGTGTGIGLAVVKKVVEGVGGRIEVESVPGKTVFRFTWPKSMPRQG